MRSIVELCAKDYDEVQINAWGRRPFNRDQLILSMRHDLVWVVELNGRIEGFGHFKKHSREGQDFGVILGLYFTPEVKGLGLGRKLVRLMEEKSHELGLMRIELQSTLTSHGFYEKLGFRAMGDTMTIHIGGVALPCVPMEKRL